MNYLLRGGEPEARVNLLLSLTSIRSDCMQRALMKYLCDGLSEKDCCLIFDITTSNFARSMQRLNAVAETVERIKEIDWRTTK